MQSTQSKPSGIAGKAGHWSANHRKLAIWGWLAFVVIAVFAGGSIGQKQLTQAERVQGESGNAERALVDAGLDPPAAESVLVESKSKTASDPAFKAAVADVAKRVGGVAAVRNVETGTVSTDRHAQLVTFEIAGDADKAADRIDPVVKQVKAAQAANSGVEIQQFGDASAEKQLNGAFADDLKKAETLSLPITLIILLIAFGSLVAAGVPVLLALSAVAAAIGLVSIPSHILPIDDSTASVIVLIGMAVGVDYSLFYMRREREERAKGYAPRDALQRAAETSGRAVLISGLTVLTAMAGMFLSGDRTFMGIGEGAMLVVAVALVGSLTVLPAMMAWLGDRIEKGRLPIIGKRRARGGNSRMWSAIVDRVMRRPLIWAIVAGAALVALAIPAFSMNASVTSPSQLPQDLPVVKAYNSIDKQFPGKNVPAVVVIKDGNARSGEMAAAIGDLKRKALATGKMYEPITTTYSKDGSVAKLEIPLTGDGADAQSKAALATLRGELIPATVGRIDHAEVNVSGMTAQTVDSSDSLDAAMPLVFGFVLALAFGLLLVTFRSIVIPIKAIVLNLLSVAAAYGVLVYVFQDGHGEQLLGFKSNGGVTAWLPLFLFVVLFGLSMDYHVFIISRIREAVGRGMNTEQAVSYGIKSTAGTVTSAAFVMVGVFSIFATLSMVDFKEMGVGLAVAILIDATIVRAVLLPATMKLLGERNWYLPKWLEWLPRIDHDAPANETAQAPRPTSRPVADIG